MPRLPRRVDHLLYGVPDLEAGIADIEDRLGVRPVPGGRHEAYGTRNALVALGPATYLEVIAPDLELPRPERGRLFGLDALEGGRLVTWVLRRERIEEAAGRARSRGVGLGPVQAGSREKPDGTVLSWRLTDPRAMPMHGVVPFLISWGDTPHPAGSAPDAGELVGLTLRHPETEAVRDALAALGAEARVEEAPRPELAATIRTDAGTVELR